MRRSIIQISPRPYMPVPTPPTGGGIGESSGGRGLGLPRKNSPKLEPPENPLMPRPKRAPPGFPDEPGYKRQRTSAPTAAPVPAPAPLPAVAARGGDLLRLFGRCRALLDRLLRHEDGWVFAAPVDARALGLRDYYTDVRDPMDLGTVLRRLERRRYAHPHAFAADVRLTFRNAMSYNNRGDPVYESAAELSGIFEAGWAHGLASLPPPPPTDAERRARLRDELPRLPVAVQQSAADILNERGACLGQGKKGKVDVDLGKADAATLDVLDRLVAQHRAPQVDDDVPAQDP